MKHLLWMDSIAGALAGVVMLLLQDWLAALYGVWALVCTSLAVRWAGTATLFGMAHLLAEALFVGGLASLE